MPRPRATPHYGKDPLWDLSHTARFSMASPFRFWTSRRLGAARTTVSVCVGNGSVSAPQPSALGLIPWPGMHAVVLQDIALKMATSREEEEEEKGGRGMSWIKRRGWCLHVNRTPRAFYHGRTCLSVTDKTPTPLSQTLQWFKQDGLPIHEQIMPGMSRGILWLQMKMMPMLEIDS